MAKLTLNTIGSRYGSIDALNANFDAIEQAVENTLSLDGTSPNTLQTNLDLGGFALLNVGAINGEDVSVLSQIATAGASAAAAQASATAAAASASSASSSASSAAASAAIVNNAKLIWKGTWDSATAYAVNDAVTYSGTSYICILANSNQTPPNTSYWDLLAQRGNDGAAGTGTGDVSSNTATSVDNELVLFSGTNGKTVKRATSNGIPKLTSGVLGTGVAGVDYIAGTVANGSAVIPTGTTGQRDGSPTAGYFRFNTSTVKFEGYNGTVWGAVGGGATGAGGDDIFYENGKTVTTNYTLTTNKNAMSTGPITINSGITVTVPSGARWVIL